jgi:hypothetical protein
LHRNIRVERTHAPHRKARKWAAFHISGSRTSFIRSSGRSIDSLDALSFATARPAMGRTSLTARTGDEKSTAMRDGQLFVYLNKPVSGIFSGLFQDVNAGKGRIWVYRIPKCASKKMAALPARAMRAGAKERAAGNGGPEQLTGGS